MHKPESVQENGMHEIRKDFEIWTNPHKSGQQISRNVNKQRERERERESLLLSGFCSPGNPQSENANQKNILTLPEN